MSFLQPLNGFFFSSPSLQIVKKRKREKRKKKKERRKTAENAGKEKVTVNSRGESKKRELLFRSSLSVFSFLISDTDCLFFFFFPCHALLCRCFFFFFGELYRHMSSLSFLVLFFFFVCGCFCPSYESHLSLLFFFFYVDLFSPATHTPKKRKNERERRCELERRRNERDQLSKTAGLVRQKEPLSLYISRSSLFFFFLPGAF